MDVKTIRRENLAILVKRAGTAVILGERAGIDPRQISHILRGVRGMGETLKKRLESSEGVELDQPINPAALAGGLTAEDRQVNYKIKREQPELPALTPEAVDLALAWMALPPDRQTAYKQFMFIEIVARRQNPWMCAALKDGMDFQEFERRLSAATPPPRARSTDPPVVTPIA